MYCSLHRTDTEDRKQAEQRLQNENVVLREEIDKASMFEQIIRTSLLLQAVISRVHEKGAFTGELGGVCSFAKLGRSQRF